MPFSLLFSLLSGRPGRTLLVGLAVLAGTLLLAGAAYQFSRQRPDPGLARDQAADQARERRQHRTDSLAAFTAGRLFEQRIAQKNLRHEDETHDSTRRAGGFIALPAFPPRRP
jgi:hypothetical protein